MTNETQAGQKGPSGEQAWILIAAGIVLALGGCGMLIQHGDSNQPQVQEFFGFAGFGAGVVLFFVGVFRIRARKRANETLEKATKVPVSKPALVMILGGTALATGAVWGTTVYGWPAWLQNFTLIAFLTGIGIVAGLSGLGKLIKHLVRSISGK